MQIIIKKTLDEWLDSVDYTDMATGSYVPGPFALRFMNLIKLINGKEGESHKTPPIHLKMLDAMGGGDPYIANLVHRGGAKTTLFVEYFTPYGILFQNLPNFGDFNSFIYISDSMENGVASARKNTEFRFNNSEFLQEWIPEVHFTEKQWEFVNKDGKPFGVKLFGAKTGLRGTKIFSKRPPVAILDDLLSDDDARSPTAINSIKDTIYKGVAHALDPTKYKVVYNGTPFDKTDPLVEAVESGAWVTSVYPVCERWPCSEEDFVGSWPDRFSYQYVKDQYDRAVLTGKVAAFMQELMLRIASDEDRLVQDAEIRWYKRTELLKNTSAYNFYITTDFATSEKQHADLSVISVWAYNNAGDWLWVDGQALRQTMDKNVDDLFKYVSKYRPQNVGIEVSGQQGAFIKWLQREMLSRNVWFNFASSSKSNEPGIRPTANKLERFNVVLPWFKMGKIYFPEEDRLTETMGHFLTQLKLVTKNGIKGKDDCIDTISMLGYLTPWKPSALAINSVAANSVYEQGSPMEQQSALSSYIV